MAWSKAEDCVKGDCEYMSARVRNVMLRGGDSVLVSRLRSGDVEESEGGVDISASRVLLVVMRDGSERRGRVSVRK